MTKRITETMKRKFVCPTCHARKGQPCMTRPKSGAGFPVPPMPMAKAHDARTRLARGGCAPVSLVWCDGTTLRQWARGPHTRCSRAEYHGVPLWCSRRALAIGGVA